MMESKFRVKDGFKVDIGKCIARVDPAIFSEENLNTGDIIKLTNTTSKKLTGAFIFPGDLRDEGTRIIRIDAIIRRNLGISINDVVKIKKTKIRLAQQVSFAGYQEGIILRNPNMLKKKLINKIVSKDDILLFRSGNIKVELIVINHTPQTEIVQMNENTSIYCQEIAYNGEV